MGEHFIHRRGNFDELFPDIDTSNLVICVSGVGVTKDFSCIMTDTFSDMELTGKSQCFPLYWYEKIEAIKNKQLDMFAVAADTNEDYYARRDGISDFILEQARKLYGNRTAKEDVFYYVYAFLHNPDYREQFASDLKKQLPRIPLIDDSVDFWKHVKSGREFADLHLHYEDHADESPVTVEFGTTNYEVTKMRFPSKDDKSRIIYNPFITISDIPAGAYEYVVNGKSAIEWVMERYQVTTNKDSGIVNDPNDWTRKCDQPRYILDLLRSVIAISVKTVEIVKNLPKVEFENNSV
jgi:predicted helicase